MPGPVHVDAGLTIRRTPTVPLALPIGQVLDESLGAFDLLEGDTEALCEGESTPPQVGHGVLIDAQLTAAHEDLVYREIRCRWDWWCV